MITVAFSPKKRAVKNMIAELFMREKILFSYVDDPEQAGYALLNESVGRNYDILLTEGNSKATADFITIIDTDSATKEIAENKSIIISYGLNSLATALITSINPAPDCLSFQFCLQRRTADIKGHILEPQEFPVRISKSDISISDALGYSVLALLLGISKEKISFI